MLLEGSGEAIVAVSPAVAFAFLSDPRNASEWFAGAGFAEAPSGPPREGLTWSFARTPGTRRVVPTRMTVYDPPHHFAWESQSSSYLTNHRWDVRCEPITEPIESETPSATATTSEDIQSPMPTSTIPTPTGPQTRLTMTITLRPGLTDLLSAAAGYVIVRRALHQQAQRAITRAAEALETRATRNPRNNPRQDRPKKKARHKGKRH